MPQLDVRFREFGPSHELAGRRIDRLLSDLLGPFIFVLGEEEIDLGMKDGIGLRVGGKGSVHDLDSFDLFVCKQMSISNT